METKRKPLTAEQRARKNAAEKARRDAIRADPERRDEWLRKLREQARARYHANIEKSRADGARRMRKRGAKRHEYDAAWRAAHKPDIAARTAENYYFGGRNEKLREAEYRRLADPEYRKRKNRLKREWNAKRKADRTVRLCDLDIEALAEHLRRVAKRGKPLISQARAIHGGWRGRIDYASPFCVDNLTPEQRAWARELAIERREQAEAANEI